MAQPRPAVHRTIMVVDVEGFGDQRRTNPHRVTMRECLYRIMEQAFRNSGIPWAGCRTEDTGDGILVLAPAELPKAPFAGALPGELAAALHEHNAAHPAKERIRLRMALHAGEVSFDEHGATAAAINLTFRLLDAPPLKAALAGSPGVLALIVSSWFFDEVVRHTVAAVPAAYRRVGVTVKETSAVAWIALPDHPYPPGEADLPAATAGPGTPVPRQLPAHTSHFVGRVDELRELTSLLDQATAELGAGDTAGTAGTVVISAIGGTAGIGKTALALHWAHQVAARFPDGQLYVNLRGFDPAGPPMKPAEAVRSFLDALAVEPGRIPVSLDAQAALYRSLLADKRVLLVLDNARDSDQVRPLLPGGRACLVVVTSRNHLASLVAAEGAHPLTLDLLTAAEARELLARFGPRRVAEEPAAADELIGLCARLPLALSIVAARAAAQPTFSLALLAAELRDARERLDALDAGELATNVRAVLSWSYEQLSAPTARMFRLLSVHPGPDISLPAAASLAGVPRKEARAALTGLTRAHLLTEYAPGRFAFHNLLRAYASEQNDTLDSAAERRAAVRRALDHYLHSGYTAAQLLDPHRDPIKLAPPDSKVTPEDHTDYERALAWFEAEYTILLAAINQAVSGGFDTHAWQISWTLATFHDWQGHWHDWVTTQSTALAAAERLDDRDSQARTHRYLGRACIRLGSFNGARTHYQRSLELYRDLGDRAGQAHAHLGLTKAFEQPGQQGEALGHAEQALREYSAAGHKAGQARALNAVGWSHALLGHHQQALTDCQEALSLQQDIGDPRGEAATWDSLGYAHHHLGRYPEAIYCYRHALDLNRNLCDRFEESDTLTRLGDAHQAASEPDAARDAWQQSLVILEDLHHPDADRVRAKLTLSDARSTRKRHDDTVPERH